MVPALEGFKVQGRGRGADPGRDILQCPTAMVSQRSEESCENSLPRLGKASQRR